MRQPQPSPIWLFLQNTYLLEVALRVRLRASGETASAAPPDALSLRRASGAQLRSNRGEVQWSQECAMRSVEKSNTLSLLSKNCTRHPAGDRDSKAVCIVHRVFNALPCKLASSLLPVPALPNKRSALFSLGKSEWPFSMSSSLSREIGLPKTKSSRDVGVNFVDCIGWPEKIISPVSQVSLCRFENGFYSLYGTQHERQKWHWRFSRRLSPGSRQFLGGYPATQRRYRLLLR